MSGAQHRQKGDRIERELVERHEALGVHAERYPLSGASRFRCSGHDVDIHPFGRSRSWADSITATPGFRFSVHTALPFLPSSASWLAFLLLSCSTVVDRVRLYQLVP
jgi:hypothetical protein